MMPFSLPGHRLQLRPIALTDVDAIMAWINDPNITRNFAGLSKTITREAELAYLEKIIASETDRLFAIETLDGQYLGNAGINQIYWPARNGRLGVVIGVPSAQGQGFGQEAIRLLVSVAFLRLKLHKVWVMHYETNARMRHICKKLGFVTEGVLRDEYCHRGEFHDMVRHSILETEFESLRDGWGLPVEPATPDRENV